MDPNPPKPMIRNRVLAALALTALVAACKSGPLPEETFVRERITGGKATPEWVEGRLPQGDAKVHFVGRGGGYNVLDERAAYDEAMAHAHAQLAGYVSTHVVAEACARDSSMGVRFLQPGRHQSGTGEGAHQSLKTCAHQISEAIVGGMAAVDQYWEQWQVKTRQQSVNDARRYKCWVLCEVSRRDIDRYVQAALAALTNELALAEAEAELAARSREDQLAQAKLVADAQLAAEDLEAARAQLAAEVHHNRLLSERIYYGRRFRLIEDEDCLHYPSACSHQAEHPAWRTTEVVTSRTAVPVATEVVVVHEPEDDAGCLGCTDCDGGH